MQVGAVNAGGGSGGGGGGGGGGGFFSAAAQGDDDDDDDSLSADAPFIIPANSGGRRFGSVPYQSKDPFTAPPSAVTTKKKGRKKMPALVSDARRFRLPQLYERKPITQGSAFLPRVLCVCSRQAQYPPSLWQGMRRWRRIGRPKRPSCVRPKRSRMPSCGCELLNKPTRFVLLASAVPAFMGRDSGPHQDGRTTSTASSRLQWYTQC